MELQGPQTVKIILKTKNKFGGLPFPNFKSTAKLQQLKKHGIGIRIAIYIDQIE